MSTDQLSPICRQITSPMRMRPMLTIVTIQTHDETVSAAGPIKYCGQAATGTVPFCVESTGASPALRRDSWYRVTVANEGTDHRQWSPRRRQEWQ